MAHIMCCIPGCTRRAKCRGWCGTHHERWRKHGDPLILLPKHRSFLTPEQHEARVMALLSNWRAFEPEVFWDADLDTYRGWRPSDLPCRVWAGQAGRDGYGIVRLAADRWSAHVFAWEQDGRPRPPGLFLDHLCCVRPCMELAHLDSVDRTENNRRAGRKRRINSGQIGVAS